MTDPESHRPLWLRILFGVGMPLVFFSGVVWYANSTGQSINITSGPPGPPPRLLKPPKPPPPPKQPKPVRPKKEEPATPNPEPLPPKPDEEERGR